MRKEIWISQGKASPTLKQILMNPTETQNTPGFKIQVPSQQQEWGGSHLLENRKTTQKRARVENSIHSSCP